ncbi:hypothetical protein BKI52_08945 [marine bacterium AO1-C]|nr:hypothetical protein BKI52_08945 [marine bacterium AO1-C]
MNHLTLKGSHYDMGLTHGGLMHQLGIRFPQLAPQVLEFGMAGLPALEQFYPEIVEEMKGFAQGIQEKFETVAGFLLSLGVFAPAGQCSIFAFRNADRVIFGRNHDFLYRFREYCMGTLVKASNQLDFVGHSDVFIGKMDGMNEKGLAVGINFVDSEERKPGINFSLMVRYLLERCTTVNEAVEVLSEAPIGSSNNYLIADAQQQMAVVEVTPGKRTVRYPSPEQAFIYSTNHFISPEMKTHNSATPNWSKSQERAQGLEQALLNSTQINLEQAQKMLSDPTCHICLDLPQLQFGTLWSFVADTQSLMIKRCEGKPQSTHYQADNRLQQLMSNA